MQTRGLTTGARGRTGQRGDAFARAIAQCFACEEACTACADACLREPNLDELRRCIRLDLDCADLCAVTARLLTRGTGSAPAVLDAAIRTCIVACDECARECARHALMLGHCRLCAEACRRCAEACRECLPRSVSAQVR